MIPDYQSLMLPLLRLSEDGREHRVRDVIEPLANQLGLSQAELHEMLPGGQPIFNNRVNWAKTYLTQAKLVEITRRAHFRITERGRDVLRENPVRVDVKLLERFPEFKEFKQRARASQAGDLFPPAVEPISKPDAVENLATPDELLRATITSIEAALSSELLDRVLGAPPIFFEELIVTLLLRMGYGGAREEAGRAIGKSGDGGIDGVIDQDPLGLDRVYLQAKRYKLDAPVSEPEIRAFSGSLGAAKASKGVFVTTSYFTRPAYEFAERHPFKMVLIDGKTALLYWDGKWQVPHGTTATTHILKPQIGRLPNGIDLSNSVENEHFCLELAAALGLSVAKSQIVDFAGKRVLSIERFDRTRTRDGRLLRLPQEDCCQALSVPPSRKYESDGGPGIRDIYDLLKGSDSPEEDQKILFKAQIVFWLLGATDGHAKNFSVRLSPGGRFRLTPLYDIVSAQPSLDTKQNSRNRMKLAMAVGKNRHYVVHTILGRHFKQTADACGLPSKAFNQIVQELGDTAKQNIDETLSKLPPDFPAAVAQSISDGAKRRIAALAGA